MVKPPSSPSYDATAIAQGTPVEVRRRYEIRLEGHIDRHWRQSFLDLAMYHDAAADGAPITVLRGEIVDEAALHGLIARVRDLGIPLILVKLL